MVDKVKIVVGRLDNNQRVEVVEGLSISSAFRTAGYSIGDNEVIQDITGTEYTGNEEVTDGAGYFLVQRVKSGC